ncbi:Arabinose-proton symporter [Symbiodinium microadriaticum]|uniref:Arabinose-proton symporter n=1 Tax=Symbiodinium microadriaticum TaxID=2951 RepID=A0A1Q9ENI2_SYMMI|nr:Arabinose-proton symporter [Symbiodinium microadriaticum]
MTALATLAFAGPLAVSWASAGVKRRPLSRRKCAATAEAQRQRTLRGQIALLGCGFLTWALCGVANEGVGLLLPQLMRDFPISPGQSGLVATSFTVGNALGLAFGGVLAERQGRRDLARLGLLAVAVAATLILGATSFSFLLAARALLGVGAGLLAVAVPSLLTESLPRENLEVAILLAGLAWRQSLALPLGFCALLLPLLLWLPESPQYLQLKGREEEAREARRKLSGRSEAIGGQSETAKESCGNVSFVRMAATLMCRHAASVLVKIWLPVWLASQGSATSAMLLMYSLEAVGIFVTSRVLAGADEEPPPRLDLQRRWFLRSHALLAGVLGAAHLIAQANSCNLLLAFASCSAETADRARTLARLNLLSFLSGSIVPSAVGLTVTVQAGSFHGVGCLLCVASALYALGAAVAPRELGGRRQVKVPLSSVKGQGFTVVKERDKERVPIFPPPLSLLHQSEKRSWVAEVKAGLLTTGKVRTKYCIKFYELMDEYVLMASLDNPHIAKTYEEYSLSSEMEEVGSADIGFVLFKVTYACRTALAIENVNEPYFGGDLTKLGKNASQQGVRMEVFQTSNLDKRSLVLLAAFRRK